MASSIGFRMFSFLPSSYSSYGAWTLTPVGLSPTVHASLRWTHTSRYKSRLDEFYKKGCQEKSSPSTGRREDFCLEIQPTACERAPRFAREVRCGLFSISAAFSFPC